MNRIGRVSFGLDRMGLRRNVIASYASQGYATVVSIVTMPLYLRYLGAETYGLVGFFSMLQAWLMLLDLGLTPTLSRETARFQGGALPAGDYAALVRVLQSLFFLMALAGGTLLYVGSDVIASKWLHVSDLPLAEAAGALRIMALIVALRWMTGFFRSILTGAERLVLLGIFTIMIATVRFVGVLLVLKYVGATAGAFFSYQLAVGAAELCALAYLARRITPVVRARRTWGESLRLVKPMIRFSLSLAFTASVWVFVTQTDKLILSKMLPLSEFGYFSLAVLVAGGVMVVSGPITGALLPRMAHMEAERDEDGLVDVYRRATQFVAVVAASTALTMALAAEPLLFAWTGDRQLASAAWRVLALYAIGNGLLALSAFPYYLQYAKGNLRMHVIGSVLFVIVLIPSIVLSVREFGAFGAGCTWLGVNLLYLLGWTPVVHGRLQPGLSRFWFSRDIAAVVAPMAIVAWLVSASLTYDDDRWVALSKIAVLFVAVAVAGALATRSGWARVRRVLVPGRLLQRN